MEPKNNEALIRERLEEDAAGKKNCYRITIEEINGGEPDFPLKDDEKVIECSGFMMIVDGERSYGTGIRGLTKKQLTHVLAQDPQVMEILEDSMAMARLLRNLAKAIKEDLEALQTDDEDGDGDE